MRLPLFLQLGLLAVLVELNTSFSDHFLKRRVFESPEECGKTEALHDCGYLGIDEAECSRRSCCWNNGRAVPWCYLPKAKLPLMEGQCSVHESDRKDCGFLGITEEGCEYRGCCYHNSTSNAPWCFKPREVHVPTVAPAAWCHVPRKGRTDCGHIGITSSGCLARGCCWMEDDTNSGPWCYKPVDPEVTSSPAPVPVIEDKDSTSAAAPLNPSEAPAVADKSTPAPAEVPPTADTDASRSEIDTPAPEVPTPAPEVPSPAPEVPTPDAGTAENETPGAVDKEAEVPHETPTESTAAPVPAEVDVPPVSPSPSPTPEVPAGHCLVPDWVREHCGEPGVTSEACKALGCCIDVDAANGAGVCFKPRNPELPVPPQPLDKEEDAQSEGDVDDKENGEVNGKEDDEASEKDDDALKPHDDDGHEDVATRPSCDYFAEGMCKSDSIETPESFEAHRWFTPRRGQEGWQQSYEDYSHMAAYAVVTYDETRTSATVEIRAVHKDKKEMSYCFEQDCGEEAKRTFTKDFTGVLEMFIMDQEGREVTLEAVDFVWNAGEVTHRDGDYREGQKGAIVEMFGWTHQDIEKECEDLAKFGYLGLKPLPVNEHVMHPEPVEGGTLNPWYFMYQPVSYRLRSRGGSRSQLRSMIRTCRSLGVRVYADAVMNHMASAGNDANSHHRKTGSRGECVEWGAADSSGSCKWSASGTSWTDSAFEALSGRSPFFTEKYSYKVGVDTNLSPSQEFPAAAYGPTDFHCERQIADWSDPMQLNAGWVSGLTDLNTEKEHVQERIAAYLTDLLSIGFSGFRVDAAKHIQPKDLAAIFAKLKRNMGGSLPPDFISWLDVDGDVASTMLFETPGEYNYGTSMEAKLLGAGLTRGEVDAIKVLNSADPATPIKTVSKKRVAVLADDHDLSLGTPAAVLRQEASSMFKDLSTTDGDQYPIRLVMSSFILHNEEALGIPDGLSDCKLCQTGCQVCVSTPRVEAYRGDSKGYDGQPGTSDYTRVHRDQGLVNAMRSWMGMPPLSGPVDASGAADSDADSEVEEGDHDNEPQASDDDDDQTVLIA